MPHRRLAAMTALCLTAVSLALATSSSARGAESAQGKAQFCHGHRATIVGTPGDDDVAGTPHRDVIVGLGGKDRIHGRGGDDILCGNGSRDRLYGGSGDDLLDGGTSDDRLYGGAGDDHVFGGAGLGDVFEADRGDDTWITGTSSSPDDHRDYFDYYVSWQSGHPAAGVTVDLPRGTAYGPDIGHDTLRVPDLAHGVKVTLTPYADALTTGPGPDDVSDTQGGGANRIDTGDGDDRVKSYDSVNWVPGDSTVLLGPGDDTLYESDGRPTVVAGPWNDHLSVDSRRVPPPTSIPGWQRWSWTTGRATTSPMLTAVAGETYLDGRGERPGLRPGPRAHPWATISGDGVDTVSPATSPDPASTPDDTFTLDLARAERDGPRCADTGRGLRERRRLGRPGDALVCRSGRPHDPNRLWYIPATTSYLPPPTNPVQIFGLGGDDSLQGGNGDDLLDGGDGQDLGSGGDGTDTCVSIEGPLVVDGATCEVSH